MASYDVLLKFEATSANSPREAAEIIFSTFFSESAYQPDVFDVVATDTGEAEEIEVYDLRNNSPLFGPKAISSRLRATTTILVEDVCTIDAGVVVLGKIQSGVVRIGDTVYSIINDMAYVSDVAGITIGRDLHELAYFTEEAGLLFKDQHAVNFVPGTLLTAHGA